MYSRGALKQPIFLDDLDRRRYLWLLAKTVSRTRWRVLSYCLMGNHMHLLIETPQPNLGDGMRLLHGPYAQGFNRRHAGAGHVFGARFQTTPITSDYQLWLAVRYIVRNPVKAGLCSTPEAWPWSSHVAVALSRFPAWLDAPRLLEYFGQDGGDPHRRYVDFVTAKINEP